MNQIFLKLTCFFLFGRRDKRGGQALSVPILKIQVNLQSPLSGSAFSDNFLGRYQEQTFFVKKVRSFNVEEREQIHLDFVYEADAWCELDHPNVLKFYGCTDAIIPPFSCLIYPWVENGDVISYLRKQSKRDCPIVKYLCNIASGLAYLHAANIVHGGLRGCNILINEAGDAVLSDYGVAPFVERVTVSMATHGNPAARFLAPELNDPRQFGLERPERTRASDIYSFAMAIIEIYTLKPPFANISYDNATIFASLKGERPARPTPTQCPGEPMTDHVWNITERCWAQNRNARPSAKETEDLLQNPRAL